MAGATDGQKFGNSLDKTQNDGAGYFPHTPSALSARSACRACKILVVPRLSMQFAFLAHGDWLAFLAHGDWVAFMAHGDWLAFRPDPALRTTASEELPVQTDFPTDEDWCQRE